MAVLGEKCSLILLFFGVWGAVMLLLLGLFARVNSVSMIEDIPINDEKWAKTKYSPRYINDQYNMVSTNCFVAAVFYGGVIVFAGIQYRLNLRSSYLLS